MDEQMVFTIDGLLPMSSLRHELTSEIGDNYMKIYVIWYKGDRLVRQDAMVNILRGQSLGAEVGGFNG